MIDLLQRLALREIIAQKFSRELNARQRRVLELCYGLNGPVLSTVEISRELGITRQRVGQIRQRALAKMRHGSRILRDFLR
jgi:RNA polymerase sigma factor (sigma-70 family)